MPVNDTAIHVDALPVSKPILVVPISAPNILPIRVADLQTDDSETSDNDEDDTGKLGAEEEAAQLGRDFGADAIGQAHDDEDDNGENLVQNAASLIGDAIGAVDALDEDDAENGNGGGHDGDDPRPCGQEAKDVAVHVLQIRLDTTCIKG